jgi:hypothetical protein
VFTFLCGFSTTKIFRLLIKVAVFELFDHEEEEGSRTLRNVGKNLAVDTA